MTRVPAADRDREHPEFGLEMRNEARDLVEGEGDEREDRFELVRVAVGVRVLGCLFGFLREPGGLCLLSGLLRLLSSFCGVLFGFFPPRFGFLFQPLFMLFEREILGADGSFLLRDEGEEHGAEARADPQLVGEPDV